MGSLGCHGAFDGFENAAEGRIATPSSGIARGKSLCRQKRHRRENSLSRIEEAKDLQRLCDAVMTCIRGKGSASMSGLRRTLASSGRVNVPFLERLDRDGVTR